MDVLIFVEWQENGEKCNENCAIQAETRSSGTKLKIEVGCYPFMIERILAIFM